ncbi:thiazole synthase [Pseudobacteriovorax antillogorgiicola]|uniref:Thiazole synthase n=1 Tax=Pseudobacteriovorax antillogorgiicola TaxID=1513793 RepID=A0A1Y6BQB7_9BACT|nr:thiazole synthase [Pseudobacteriovorax antillogorgiicola]TCS53940.1 thiazole-phosphate synthase [Pseudobacteriovorax antillogorgiicola]SMF20272.1 thiazole-phosphate synthase [Pseudobacteriovorax antillogorgiicola]
MWTIADKTVSSRLLLGTARYPSPATMKEAIQESGSDIITVSLRRESVGENNNERFWDYIKNCGAHILPNTAGCHSVRDAVTTAHMARDLFSTHWIKLEVIGNDETLQPDPFALVEAARILNDDGFEVFPYSTEDLIVAEKLVSVGCKIVMPWGSPIGSGQGLRHREALKTLRQRLLGITLIVDAGIGKPSHAAAAMEMGFDGVLLNTAVALAQDPVRMATAFGQAVTAGRTAFEAGMMQSKDGAEASTPTIGVPFWHEEARL